MPDPKPRLVIVLDDGCIQHIYSNVPGLTVAHEIDPVNDVANRVSDLRWDDPKLSFAKASRQAQKEHNARSKRLLDGLKDIDTIKVYDDPD